ncbi:MAG: hypothetical protein LC713_01560 [Actinobacteria bacterium]|nr:hypothetical protein [Actinomycetota bacterium]
MSSGRSRRAGLAAGTLAIALIATSCGVGGAPLPPRPPVVGVKMREFAFDHGRIPRGRAVFLARNLGRINHRLSLVPLPEDMPPILDQLRGEQRQTVFTLAAVADVVPGETGTFAVDLGPGRYARIDFIVDADGTSHALKGMATEFRIR